MQEKNTNNVKALLIKNGVSQDERIVVVNATASNPFKTWGLHNFSEIIEYLVNNTGVRVGFIGSDIDYDVYNRMNYSNALKKEPVNLCGKLSIQDSLALLKEAEFIIGNDSGPLHMASSVGTAVIGLYGPMPFEKWYALGGNNILLKADLTCIPCGLKKKCNNKKACMKAISIDAVKQAVDNILKENIANC